MANNLRSLLRRFLLCAALAIPGLCLASCASPPASQCAPEARSLATQKWEYKIVPTSDQEKDWNQLGEEGWEYAATIQQHNQFLTPIHVFKRPKKD